MKKKLAIAGGVITTLGLVLLLTWKSMFITRVLIWNNVSIDDYKIFPERVMTAPADTWSFEKDTSKLSLDFLNLNFKEKFGFKNVSHFEELLRVTGTTSLLILKNDTLVYENYFNDYDRHSINTSFSISKSVASALVGIAIDEGHIESVKDPISRYIPELQNEKKGRVTIEELITMYSNIAYNTESVVFGDEARAYYEPDLRSYALDFELNEDSDNTFEYNNIHPLLIGIVLERATGKTVTQYLEEKIWKPMGAEFDGSWSLDDSGFEKMESGINARSIDFLKFGRLYLQEGEWDGKQLIPASYVKSSTSLSSEDEHLRDVLIDTRSYKYFWWILERDSVDGDYYGEGNKGQFLYISPSTKTVILRNGKEYGYGRWPEFFYKLVDELETH